MEYCKEILNQIVLPGKKLVKHINDAVRLHDGEINVLIEKYTRKEKTIKKLADAVNSCAKQVDHVKNALLEHRIKLAKQYPDFVNNPANGHESIRAGDESLLQKGFLRKKAPAQGTPAAGIGNRPPLAPAGNRETQLTDSPPRKVAAKIRSEIDLFYASAS